MADAELCLQEIGRRIMERRKKLGLTQEALAEKAEVTAQFVSYAEAGKRAMRPENLMKMASALEVSADYLLGRGTEPLGGSSDGALSALHAALSERDDPELSAAAERDIQAAVRRLCDEIYGVADARSMSRQSLEMAEAERAIAERSPDKRHAGRFSDK